MTDDEPSPPDPYAPWKLARESSLMDRPTKRQGRLSVWWRKIPLWARNGSITLVALTLAYRIATQELVIPQLTFSEFLSLVLALFAIALAASFFFKATDTADRFYNNTYTFTKDISEKLGRLEERFGEQMKGMQKSMDRIPEMTGLHTKAQEEKKEAEIVKLKREMETNEVQLRAEIAQQLEAANVAAATQDEILDDMKVYRAASKKLEVQLTTANRDLAQLKLKSKQFGNQERKTEWMNSLISDAVETEGPDLLFSNSIFQTFMKNAAKSYRTLYYMIDGKTKTYPFDEPSQTEWAIMMRRRIH